MLGSGGLGGLVPVDPDGTLRGGTGGADVTGADEAAPTAPEESGGADAPGATAAEACSPAAPSAGTASTPRGMPCQPANAATPNSTPTPTTEKTTTPGRTGVRRAPEVAAEPAL
ncbi:MAG: hypothetical protein CVU63_07360, partial [Deltaproteobacteria bacterium HGW-Deltaproteobacteria-20]